MEIRNILVPTDFSEEANNALGVAVEIANVAGAEVSLLHVVDVPTVAHYDSVNVEEGYNPELYDSYTRALRTVVQSKMERYKNKYENVIIKEHIVFDSLQRHIADFIAKDQADLVVMGSSGVSGMDEIFVGSNTEKVIRFSKAPVLVVKAKDEAFFPTRVVFASSFQKVSDYTVRSLKAIQALFNADICFVKIITPNNFEATNYTIEMIKEFAKENGFESYTAHTFNHFNEEEGIREFAEFIDADLITMTTHGRSGLSHLLLGSIAEEVANHALTPVMTFNEHHNKTK